MNWNHGVATTIKKNLSLDYEDKRKKFAEIFFI